MPRVCFTHRMIPVRTGKLTFHKFPDWSPPRGFGRSWNVRSGLRLTGTPDTSARGGADSLMPLRTRIAGSCIHNTTLYPLRGYQRRPAAYLVAGTDDPVVLLHGMPKTSHM